VLQKLPFQKRFFWKFWDPQKGFISARNHAFQDTMMNLF